MGSEDDMIARFGVSRPTFRQAAALLAQEQLLIIKRGVGGGYFASRPKPGAVAHITAVYLQTKQVTVEEIFLAITPLRIELSRLASRCADKKLTTELGHLIEQDRELDLPKISRGLFDMDEYRAFLRTEREFGRLLGLMAENRVLHLFLDMIYEFFAMMSKDDDVYRRDLDRIQVYRKLRQQLMEAIHNRDEKLAVLYAERAGAALSAWLSEDRDGRTSRSRRRLEVM